MTDLTSSSRAECSEKSYGKKEEEKNQTYENSNIMQGNTYCPEGFAKTSHGIVYQLYIIMYYILWVSKKNRHFRFLSEADGCGQLDDVILISNNKNNCTGSFMQVKHRLNSKIPIKYDDLIKADKNFSILKYFLSYKTLQDNKEYDYVSNKLSYLLSNNGFEQCQNLQKIITKVDNTVLSETPLHKDNDESFGNIQCFKIICNVSVIRNIALMKILSNEQVENFINDNQNLFHESFLEYFKDNKKIFNTLSDEKIKLFLPCLSEILINITKFKQQGLPRLFDLFFKDEEVDELFDKFKESFTFVTFVPDYEVMESLIKKLMGERFKLIDPANITDSFQIKIINWLNIGKNIDKSTPHGKDNEIYVMTEDKVKEWFEDLYILYSKSVVVGMTKQVKSDYIHENLVFEEKLDFGYKIKEFLADNKHILEVKSEDPEICLNLIWQRVNKLKSVSEDDYFVVSKLNNFLDDAKKDNHILNAFKHPGSHHLLALIVLKENKDFDKDEIKNAFDSIREILKLNNKRIMIILKPDIVLFTNLTNQELSQSISYSFEFSHLNVETRTFILDEQICFQGKRVSLKTIMDKNEADKFINSEILSKILKNQLEIGYSFDYASVKNGKNYIHRTLSRKVKLEPKKLREDQLKNDMLILSKFREEEANSKVIFNIFRLAFNKLHLKSWGREKNNKHVDKTIRVVTQETPINQDVWAGIVKKFNHVPNIHWLEVVRIYKETAIFHWKDSKGDHSLLKNYLTSETDSPGLYEDKDVIEILCKDKLCIVSNNPGFGKSTFMRALGEKIKSEHPSSWVFVIKLNKYGNMNKKYNLNNIEIRNDSCDDETYLIEHLFKMILHLENSKKQRTFDQQLLSNKIKSKSKRLEEKSPDIYFLFDGFDEISPTYKEKTMRIIKAVRNNPAFSTLVTTRLSTEKELKKQLQKLSLHLDLLTEENQKQFIYHELKAKGIENGKLLTNVMEKINEVEKRLKGNSFSRNPLNLSMLVEIFGNEQSSTSTEEINLLTLYKKFVDIKWKNYNDEKCLNVEGNQPQTVKDIIFEDKLNKIHAELALLVLMPDKTEKKKLKELNNFIDFLERRNKNGHEEISRIGIVNYSNCLPRFSHRSFAEYFLSDFLIKDRDNIFYKEIFKEVLTKKRIFSRQRIFNSST